MTMLYSSPILAGSIITTYQLNTFQVPTSTVQNYATLTLRQKWGGHSLVTLWYKLSILCTLALANTLV